MVGLVKEKDSTHGRTSFKKCVTKKKRRRKKEKEKLMHVPHSACTSPHLKKIALITRITIFPLPPQSPRIPPMIRNFIIPQSLFCLCNMEKTLATQKKPSTN